MTFDEIVADVRDRLNLTSPASLTRTQGTVNTRYQMILGEIGMKLSSRITVSAPLSSTSKAVNFTGIQRLDAVYDLNANSQPRVYQERPVDYIRSSSIRTTVTPEFAVEHIGAHSFRLLLARFPEADGTIYADGMGRNTILTGNMEPAFPEAFHYVLFDGSMADEAEKMDKMPLSLKKDKDYDEGLAKLRYHQSCTAFLEFTQGDRK